MFTKFIDKKLNMARYKKLKDGTYFAEVPGVRGVWSNAKTKKACRTELKEVLEEWVLLKIHDQESIPGFSLNFERKSMHV